MENIFTYITKEVYLPIVYILGAVLIYWIFKRAIKRTLALKIGKIDINERREKTLVGLLTNIFKYILYFTVIVLILNVYGINTTTMLAGLGVLGLIIGLGVQDTIRDFLSGFFIIFDNQYAVGDTIEIKTFVGEVIELGLKTTKLKSPSGKIKSIPNRNVTEVTNYSIYPCTLNIDINTTNEKEIDKKMLEVAANLEKNINKITGNVETKGITKLKDSITYTIALKTKYKYIEETKREIYTKLPDILIKNKVDYKIIEVSYE